MTNESPPGMTWITIGNGLDVCDVRTVARGLDAARRPVDPRGITDGTPRIACTRKSGGALSVDLGAGARLASLL